MKSIKYLLYLWVLALCVSQTLTAQRPNTNNSNLSRETTPATTADPKTKKTPPPTPTKNEPAKTGQKTVEKTSSANAPSGASVVFKADTILKLKDSPKIEVVEINEYMSQGQRSGVRALVPLNSAEQVEKAWKQYIKPFKGKTKNAFRDEVFTDNAMIKKLSENPVDIYTKIEDSANGVLLRAFFDLGGIFVSTSTNADKFAIVKNIIREFAALQTTQKLEQKMTKEEGKLLDIATQRQDLEIQIEQMKLDLEMLKETIYKTEQKIKTTQALKEEKDLETKKQIEVVEQLKKDINSVSIIDNK